MTFKSLQAAIQSLIVITVHISLFCHKNIFCFFLDSLTIASWKLYEIEESELKFKFFYLLLGCTTKFFIYYQAVPRPTLNHYRGNSFTHSMLITARLSIVDPKVTGSLVTSLGP